MDSKTAYRAPQDVNTYEKYSVRDARVGVALPADPRPSMSTGDAGHEPRSNGRRPIETTTFTSAPAQQQPAPNGDAVAWSLVAAAHSRLRRPGAHHIYIAIGVGDTFDAIEALLAIIVQHRVCLDEDLRAAVAAWLDRYRGQDAELRLRQLLRRVHPTMS